MATLFDVESSAKLCVACALSAGRTQVVFGRGNPSAELMFVGEAPGRDEDLEGAPFVGRSGKLLDRLVREELAMDDSSYYVANVVKCRPPNNRDPLAAEVATCRHWLDSQIALVDPKVIVTLGNFATRAILETAEGITRMRGQVHPGPLGIAVVPTFHPSAALRFGGAVVAEIRADLIRAKRVLTPPV